MKPERRTRYAAAITLSKSKMYEYGVPEDDHLELPKDLDLEMQFPMAIGTLGDYASETLRAAIGYGGVVKTPQEEVVFSARVLQAYDDSLLNSNLSSNLRVLAAAGFYMGDTPGSAAVQLSKLAQLDDIKNDPLVAATRVAMDRPWNQTAINVMPSRAEAILDALGNHFRNGSSGDHLVEAIKRLRQWAYGVASAHELLMAELLGAVSITRISNSAWTLLPRYSEIALQKWEPYLTRTNSIKEMWPSQRMLGEAGLYKGQSGVVQMPTSAGKSRATELVIRSAFLSGRTKLALVIAPFRALCQEIATHLEKAFKEDGCNVNQLSDALQADIVIDIFDVTIESRPQVVVVTPEKLLYMLRQDPEIVKKAGLVVYDEGHQFDSGSRGVTYELLLTSIKKLLPDGAQSILISAVIENAAAVASWLLGDETKVVSNKLLQVQRLIAFASLPKGKDGQLQFNVASENEQKFFVPRVIVQEKLRRYPRETKDRFFPNAESGSIALYLGLKLLSNGGVAIYVGRKVSAAKIVKEAVEETFSRGISLAAPSACSDPDEITRFVHLFSMNFGDGSYLTKAAALGIFAHHGNTPQGVRLSIEYAMRQRLIRLIVCTSTLAQGVNLPIRYLLVTSSVQGRESIKARDFHNLMGRAGRAGMYGEGTVIFTDHKLYDERVVESRRWESAIKLINSDSTEPTGSTLLSLFDPMRNDTGTRVLAAPSPADIAKNIVDNWDDLWRAVENLSVDLQRQKFSVASLRNQLEAKREIINAVESFLMTYRGDVDSEAFIENSRALANETLAYSLASPEQKELLTGIFEAVANRIENLVPATIDQRRFGRTLLGVKQALEIESWVKNNIKELEATESSEELLEILWPLLGKLSGEKRLTDTTPNDALKSLAINWINGLPFSTLLAVLDELGASYPYRKGRRGFDIDQVVDVCEQTFGFEFALLLAAVNESFIANSMEEVGEEFKLKAELLQKQLKYGLPNQETIAYFEAGFSERVIAQLLSDAMIWESAKTFHDVRRLMQEHPEDFKEVLRKFPAYFTDIFQTITAS